MGIIRRGSNSIMDIVSMSMIGMMNSTDLESSKAQSNNKIPTLTNKGLKIIKRKCKKSNKDKKNLPHQNKLSLQLKSKSFHHQLLLKPSLNRSNLHQCNQTA
jgi:hypothetical protein